MEEERRYATQPTLTIDDAAQTNWDIVVVGAGPAGALAARQVALQGIRVLLIDKASFPRDKVCGSCLNGAALKTLDLVGLGSLAKSLGGTPLTALRLRAGRQSAALRLPGGVALSRKALDGAMVKEAIAAGVSFLGETPAQLDPIQVVDSGTNEQHRVQLSCGTKRATVAASVVIAADGLAGGFLRHWTNMISAPSPDSPAGIGAIIDDSGADFNPGTIYMACAPGGYVGIVRLEDGRLDVAAAVDRELARMPGGASAAVIGIVRRSGFAMPHNLPSAEFRGTPHLTRRRTQVAAPGLFVIGDAAGYIEPFTGEGMSWAMQQAVLVATLAVRAARQSGHRTAIAGHWQQLHAQFFRRRRAVCVATRMLRRRFKLAQLTVAVLGRIPTLAGPWVRAVNRPDREILRLNKAVN